MRPIVEAHHVEATQARFRLRIELEQPCFQGHFPGKPVLAGVVQLSWAIELAREWLAVEGEFSGMEVVKFQRPIVPPGELQLELTWQAEQQKLLFRYLQDDALCASGRIRLERVS